MVPRLSGKDSFVKYEETPSPREAVSAISPAVRGLLSVFGITLRVLFVHS
jgi:hypothetical protein